MSTIRSGTVVTSDLATVVAIKGAQSSALPVTSTSTSTTTTAAVTRVPTNVASVTILAANADRAMAEIFNNSAASNLFIKKGATANIGAGTESFTTRIPPLGLYTLPTDRDGRVYGGIIDGIWDAADANGEALVTEEV